MSTDTVLVTGATGFIGRRLCEGLTATGSPVRAMTRHPDTYSGPAVPTYGDVHDPNSLADALRGCDAAYYLVHSLDRADFRRLDARAARTFAAAAAAAGLRRIVYLGGLGDDRGPLSEHLRSRREVEHLLAGTGVPVTTLRAGIVIGRGGISWELTRQLVHRVPAMLAPSWVNTRTQPIALPDAVRYLVEVLDRPDAAGRAFEIGGPDVLSYADMVRRVGELTHRPTVVLPVPLLATLLRPPLSHLWAAGHWISLALAVTTDVDIPTSRALIASMAHEMVVRDRGIRELVPFDPMSYDQAVRAALAEPPATRTAA
jgi:uncharacterized protein YbjT (DUF2867 family)